MNDDLISRKALLGKECLLMTDIVENNPTAKYILEQVLYDIEHAETAFDKEKVIEKLKDAEDIPHDDSVAEITSTRIWNKAITKSIKIVEKGGIE